MASSSNAVYEDIEPELKEHVEDVIFARRPDATERLAAALKLREERLEAAVGHPWRRPHRAEGLDPLHEVRGALRPDLAVDRHERHHDDDELRGRPEPLRPGPDEHEPVGVHQRHAASVGGGPTIR